MLGYTIVNDVSARDFQIATTQWLMGKTFDTFCPMGPWIVTKDEIADPHALDISLEIGGETLQNSNTREMVFRVPDADRIRFHRGDARAGRRVHHRHSRGRRIRPQTAAVAETRRRSHCSHLRHRRVEEPDSRRRIMQTLFQDIRFGARVLLRSPGMTLAVILALALGIGANTAMFSVVDALILHPLRYQNPSELVVVWDRDPQGQIRGSSSGNFLDWRRPNHFPLSPAGHLRQYTLTGLDGRRRFTERGSRRGFSRRWG